MKLRDAQMAERTRTLATARASLKHLDEAESDPKKRLQDSSVELHQFFKEMQSKCVDDIAGLGREVAGQQAKVQQMNQDIEHLKSNLEIEEGKLQTISEAGSSDKFKDQYKKNIEVLQSKYAGFDVEKMNKTLTYAKAHMEDGQLLYTNLLESYKMAAEPASNMISELKQRNGSRINNVTGPRKVQEYYRQSGGLILGVSAASAGPNWVAIVHSICHHETLLNTPCQHVTDTFHLVDSRDGYAHVCTDWALKHTADIILLRTS